MEYEKELQVAVAAVRRACGVCQAVQADLVTAATLEKKDNSPVTVADYAAQAVVCAALNEAFPGAPGAGVRVVGEEDSAELRAAGAEALLAQVAGRAGLNAAEALAAIDVGGFDPAAPGTPGTPVAPVAPVDSGSPLGEGYWTLDPIDGTKGFLRGEQYAVALALIERGRVVLGVLGCPNLDGGLLIVAARGQGARRLALHDDDPVSRDAQRSASPGEPLPIATGTIPLERARFCESVESGHSDQGASAAIAAALGITAEPYRIDSQCKYAAVAMGHAQIYLRLPTKAGYREKVWDHAAGMVAVQEAGGTVTDVRGKPLDFSRGRQLEDNRGIIATRGVEHRRVVEAVVGVIGEVE